MASTPRLRIAPSPTGMFHVGNARSALFNWLYVRRTGGTFILRIEDTDEERNREEWVGGILDAMRWLGMDWDEGPTRQSDNKPAHSAAAATIYEQGLSYYCECTREQIEERAKNNDKPGYDNFCRDRNLEPGEGRAMRFRVPAGKTVVHDLIRGDVEFDNSNVEDFAIVRSSGVPLYVLANVVDDMTDRITHIVRGEEHLPNTPKQIMLWTALREANNGPELPLYAHLPVIVNEKRQKLSKRRDKVAIEMYRDEGYLGEAMRNYLALLGWAPKGDREIVTVDELIAEFDLADVQKSSAFFDVVKLNHINGEYIRALPTDEFIRRVQPFLDDAGGDLWPKEQFDHATFNPMAKLVQERVDRLDAVAPMVDFLFVDEPEFDEAAMKVLDNPASLEILRAANNEYQSCEWTSAALHEVTLRIGEANGLKLGKAQAPIRLAVTGKKVGPPLFESIEVLGREKTLARVQRLLQVAADRG